MFTTTRECKQSLASLPDTCYYLVNKLTFCTSHKQSFLSFPMVVPATNDSFKKIFRPQTPKQSKFQRRRMNWSEKYRFGHFSEHFTTFKTRKVNEQPVICMELQIKQFEQLNNLMSRFNLCIDVNPV